jgi:hypothetical protein
MSEPTSMTFCVRLGPGAPLDKIGGKARSLLRLAEAGLPVPIAIVVTTDLLAKLRAGGPKLPSTLNAPGALTTVEGAARALAAAPWPEGFASTLAREIDTLVPEPGARYAVRSSASIEDEAGALAAGLFLSRIDVARVEVLEAVRAVLGSAISPAVIAYLAQHGLCSDNLGFAVLIHEFVEGEANGAAAFDPARGEPPTIEVQAGRAHTIEGAARARLEEAARSVAKTNGAVELEWVVSDGRPTFLQLRPLQSPARMPVRPAIALPSFDPMSAAKDRDLNDTDWHWDAAHNPLPLSPAQAGLVSLVDEQCKIGLRQRVVGGYLFYATDPTSETTPIGAADALRGVWEAARQRLARPTPTLEQSLETFVAIYQPLFGSCSRTRAPPPACWRRSSAATASIRRRCCPSCCRACRRPPPSARGARGRWPRRSIRSCAAAALESYLEEFGDEAPRWDVAAPTWRERSSSLERLMRGTNVGAPIDDRSWREASDAVRGPAVRGGAGRMGAAPVRRAAGGCRRRRRRRAVRAAASARAARAVARGRTHVAKRRARRSERGVLAAAGCRASGCARRGAAGLRGGGAGVDGGAQRRCGGAHQSAAAGRGGHAGRRHRRGARAAGRRRRAHRPGPHLPRRSRAGSRRRRRAGGAHAAADGASPAVARRRSSSRQGACWITSRRRRANAPSRRSSAPSAPAARCATGTRSWSTAAPAWWSGSP